MEIDYKLEAKVLASIPFQINLNVSSVMLNNTNPVSIKPIVAGVERNSKYPIIFVPGVMGSKLFKNIYAHGEERRFYNG